MLIIRILLTVSLLSEYGNATALVATTWALEGFQLATDKAYKTLMSTNDRLESLLAGLGECESLQCDGTVGYGGSPDETGETRLDALVFDGPGHKVGAVASMANVKKAARVAHAVMKYTKHSMIAGSAATDFAVEMGFKHESLYTNNSHLIYEHWRRRNCQPNFRKNVFPDADSNCGPYKPLSQFVASNVFQLAPGIKHDTIGMIVIDHDGNISAGTSTNGASHKIAGRVGDSSFPGAGAYVDNNIGAAVATGDGDILMRFAPSYQAVESMRGGQEPRKAAEVAVRRIADHYSYFSGAVVAVNKAGEYGAACHGFTTFNFCLQSLYFKNVRVISVKCL